MPFRTRTRARTSLFPPSTPTTCCPTLRGDTLPPTFPLSSACWPGAQECFHHRLLALQAWAPTSLPLCLLHHVMPPLLPALCEQAEGVQSRGYVQGGSTAPRCVLRSRVGVNERGCTQPREMAARKWNRYNFESIDIHNVSYCTRRQESLFPTLILKLILVQPFQFSARQAPISRRSTKIC